jgi:hypothetical protein
MAQQGSHGDPSLDAWRGVGTGPQVMVCDQGAEAVRHENDGAPLPLGRSQAPWRVVPRRRSVGRRRPGRRGPPPAPSAPPLRVPPTHRATSPMSAPADPARCRRPAPTPPHSLTAMPGSVFLPVPDGTSPRAGLQGVGVPDQAQVALLQEALARHRGDALVQGAVPGTAQADRVAAIQPPAREHENDGAAGVVVREATGAWGRGRRVHAGRKTPKVAAMTAAARMLRNRIIPVLHRRPSEGSKV